MRRRSVIAILGMLTAGTSSGCISSIRDAVNPTAQLGWFGVHNADTESSHRFVLEVERDGEVVHSSSHTVDAAREYEGGGQHNDGAVAECEWGSTPGDYTVRVRVDDGEWVEASVTEFATSRDVDCVVADAEYRSTLTIYLKEGCDRDGYGRMCSFTNE
ncbi:hypothetical protein ACFQJ3_01930 [Salinibaculum sp. GCM10025337]